MRPEILAAGEGKRALTKQELKTFGVDYKIFWEIVFGEFQKPTTEAHVDWEDAIKPFSRIILANSKQDEGRDYDRSKIVKSLQGEVKETQEAYKRFLQSFSIESAALYLPDGIELVNDEHSNNVMATIADIPLINAEHASFSQIHQLREDKEAKRKLRNLRLFLFENYSGKPKSFIEDDIQKKMDDYHTAASKHGFEILESSIACLIDTKSIQATLAGGLIGWLLGGPIVGAASGFTAEVISLTLTLTKGIREFRMFRNQHDLAYIFHAKKSIEK